MPAPVTVLILAPLPDPAAGPLERLLDDIRAVLLEHHRAGFDAAGAARVVIRQEPPDDTPFGARLRRLVDELRPAGLVVMGAGSMPLARPSDLRAFVDAAAAATSPAPSRTTGTARTASRSRGAADALRDLPGGPRLGQRAPALAGRGGRYPRPGPASPGDTSPPTSTARSTPWCSPGAPAQPASPLPAAADAEPVRVRLAALRAVTADPGGELLVAGRLAAVDLRWVRDATPARAREP